MSVLSKSDTKSEKSALLKAKTPFQLYAEHHQIDGDHSQLRDQYTNLSIDEKYKWVIKAVSLAPVHSIETYSMKIIDK